MLSSTSRSRCSTAVPCIWPVCFRRVTRTVSVAEVSIVWPDVWGSYRWELDIAGIACGGQSYSDSDYTPSCRVSRRPPLYCMWCSGTWITDDFDCSSSAGYDIRHSCGHLPLFKHIRNILKQLVKKPQSKVKCHTASQWQTIIVLGIAKTFKLVVYLVKKIQMQNLKILVGIKKRLNSVGHHMYQEFIVHKILVVMINHFSRNRW